MVVEIRITTSGEDLKGWIKGIQTRVIPKAMKTVTLTLATEVRDLARNNVERRTTTRTGRLANNIWAVNLGGKNKQGYSVIASAPYAAYVEAGTQPHFIPNGLGRAEGVNHPGSKPTWFMRDAFNSMLNQVEDRISSSFGKGEFFR